MRVKAEAAGINALFDCFCLGRRAAGGGQKRLAWFLPT